MTHTKQADALISMLQFDFGVIYYVTALVVKGSQAQRTNCNSVMVRHSLNEEDWTIIVDEAGDEQVRAHVCDTCMPVTCPRVNVQISKYLQW